MADILIMLLLLRVFGYGGIALIMNAVVKTSLHIFKHVVVWVFSLIFMFRELLILLKTLLFPHTRVCGLCRGGSFNFLEFCWDIVFA